MNQMWWHSPLRPAFRKQRQVNFCKFKANPVYIVKFQANQTRRDKTASKAKVNIVLKVPKFLSLAQNSKSNCRPPELLTYLKSIGPLNTVQNIRHFPFTPQISLGCFSQELKYFYLSLLNLFHETIILYPYNSLNPSTYLHSH